MQPQRGPESVQLSDEVRAARGTGQPLDAHVRQSMEQRFGASLRAVRVHTGPTAARLATALRAQAFTTGTDVFFGPGAYRPDTRTGRRLLAHEIAHVLQQAAGSVPAAPTGGPFIGRSGDVWERAASDAADRVTAGITITSPTTETNYRFCPDPAVLAIQCHDSFEHRALGDVPTGDLVTVSAGGSDRTEILNREIALMWLWHQDPNVAKEKILELCPWTQTVTLEASGLLVTYGELNALPDYIPTAATADTLSYDTLMPVLQFIRQEGYIELNKLLNKTVTDAFKGAVFSPSQWAPGLLNRLLESKALDDLTLHLGIAGTDHYSGLLGRNACHFAPFSWHRWQASHLIARDLATRSHAESDPNEKARLKHQALVQQGYGDHFLQDSFAAGHLVNKTLIMQWFIAWAANQKLVPVANWDVVKNVTADLQPGLAGRALYSPDFPGPSNDPQTSEEQATYLDRLRATGVVVGASGDLDTAYQDYLAFLSSLITQSSSAAIHDYYNTNSLWVASKANPTPYEVYGDDTLLSGANGGGGVQATSEASQLSQECIRELLDTGSTSITTSQIRDHFPTQVRGADNTLLSLEAWNDTQPQFCADKIFPGLHDVIVRLLSPEITNISRDQDLTTRWSTSLPNSGFTTTSVLLNNGRLFLGSNGRVYELDKETGAVLHDHLVSDVVGVGDYETRLATDGSTLFVGVHGYVYGVNLADWSKNAWECSLTDAGYTIVDLLVAGGRVYAGSQGRVYDIEPSTGHIARWVRLKSLFGTGDYTMRLTMNGSTLIAGAHGYVYAVDTASFSGAAWECSLPDAGYHPVDVLIRNGALYAGTNGYVYQVDPGNGSVVHKLRVTDAAGVGDYTTMLAADDQFLFTGVHGYVYGVRFSDWSKWAWEANLAGNRYSMANVSAFGGQLLAGSYGYVFRIDPATGRILRNSLITSAVGVGNYETRLAVDPAGQNVYTGIHGYGYDVSSEFHTGSTPST